ncbi:hypothetical protein [Streptomyces sp. MUM 178J]|uniref:hypothetical protein n=1 Tax=Streptomyces sp. MUM 178J TaxID=2791991 RepID=UPI001F03D931|nr:hypothetical protein [Streptomyces sp. MUM 178J]WRQ82333.1 hypothetical protein I3F59_024905 [Streptomyces sp. MUM 178J]
MPPADPDAPRPWTAVEYIPALVLSDLVRDAGPLPAWAVPSIAAGVVRALLALHAEGVIHRDVKPGVRGRRGARGQPPP